MIFKSLTYPTRYNGKPRRGKGSFSSCYFVDGDETCFVLSIDKVKELISLGWSPESDLFPTIHRRESLEGYEWKGYTPQVYEMPVYQVRRDVFPHLDKHNADLYRILKMFSPRITRRKWDNVEWMREFFNGIPDRFGAEREALSDMVDSLLNYGDDFTFEISPRNVATKNGKLILLDCFFYIHQLKETRT